MKKPDLKLNGETVSSPWVDSGFALAYPHIYEHLHEEKYEDGTLRQTSTLLIFNDGGCLKLCLSDRDNNRSVFVTATCFDDAMVRLEQGLREDDLEWRVKPQSSRQGNRPPF